MLFEERVEAIKFRVKQSTLTNYFRNTETHILPVFRDIQANEIDASDARWFI